MCATGCFYVMNIGNGDAPIFELHENSESCLLNTSQNVVDTGRFTLKELSENNVIQ